MNAYLVKGGEFFLAEEDGGAGVLTRGFTGGIAIKRRNPMPNFLARKIYASMHRRRHVKECFERAERGWDPRVAEYVDLDARMLPNAEYYERDDDEAFFEISSDGGVLRVRRGRSGGLGETVVMATEAEAGGAEARERMKRSLVAEREAEGYKRLLAGPTFSLRIVSGELARGS